MISLLARILIKTQDAGKRRKAYGTLCSIVGVLLNFFLFLIKTLAGYLSGSVAIMADAFNNLSDAGSSFMTFVGFWFAGKKPDIDHPFGHGRFEYISGLGVAVMIILMGFELGKDSVWKILYPKEMHTETVVIFILIASICVKLYMAFYNWKIGKKIDSSAMLATATDSISDVFSTLFILISVSVYKYADINVDGICGFIVSIMIMYAGFNVAKETLSPLLGQPPKQEFVDEIYEIVMSHSKIQGIHDLVVHDYGPGRVMISLHTEVPGDEDVFKIHDLIDRIENELNEKLGCEAVIHMDPIEVDNEVIKTTKKQVVEKIVEIDEGFSIHDFRMVTGDTHTNLIFDIVVPYSIKMSDDEIKKIVQEKIFEINETYFTVIHIDREYLPISKNKK